MSDVETARKKLLEALGEYAERYWSNMKLWYKQKISKDTFDTEAFELLGLGKITYHNQFMLSILARCQAVAATPAITPSKPLQKSSTKSVHIRKPRVKPRVKQPSSDAHRFHPYDQMDSVPQLIAKGDDHDIRLCSQELVLPDIATLHGRLFLGAWDVGLDSITDETAPLMSQALEVHLKNILSAVIARRKNFKVRDGGNFRHRYTTVMPRPGSLEEDPVTEKPSSDVSLTCAQAEAEAYQTLGASEATPTVLRPISLFDVRDTLEVNRHLIPSHTVYTGNMERLLADMWHPGHDEMEQNNLYVLETRRLQERFKQRGLRV